MAHNEPELAVFLRSGKNSSKGIGTLPQPQILPFNFILPTRYGVIKMAQSLWKRPTKDGPSLRPML